MPTEMTRRAATLAPGTFNRVERTVEAVLSAGSPVQRRDARGEYTERLATTADAVTLGANRIPILDSHRQGSISDILGYVENIRFEAGEIRATLRIVSDAALDLIEAGALTGISIGYRVTGWVEADGGRIRTATRWTLLEASLVSIPADPAAVLRSDTPMLDDQTTTETAPANRAEANTAIRNLGATMNLGQPWVDAQIDAGADVLAARAAALTEIERRTAAGSIRVHQIGQSGDDPAVIQTRQIEALAHDAVGGDLPEPARQFRGMSIPDHCRHALNARGERGVQFMTAETLITRATTTGDLQILLTGTSNRVLAAAYAAAPNPLKALARQTTAVDFRSRTVARFGEMAGLERVPESGEITAGGSVEAGETYAMQTYGKTYAVTRQALINDDKGAITTVPAGMGRAAAETEAGLLVSLLTQASGAGPTMSDSIRLFNSAHGNLAGSGTVIDTTNLGAARLAMRSQKGLDGVTPINATPKFLLVSATKETQAEQVLASIYAATVATANPFSGRLELLVEPRLSGNGWYLFSDPATLPILEYCYLSGAPGPQIESRPGWDVLGMEFRVVLDFGCGAVDWRGAYRNPGA